LAPSDFHLFGPLKNHLGGKGFADDAEVETEVRKWLRQQPKYFYAAGFDAALAKRLENCINVGGGYMSPRFEYHMFHVLYPFVTYLLTLLHTDVRTDRRHSKNHLLYSWKAENM
jgi:hypothetical protein